MDTRREVTMAFFKLTLAVLSLLAGSFFLYEGLGEGFRILNYEELKAYGIPIGILFLVLGMWMARSSWSII
jgi:hypothetical protein